jgi:hypothetical protein
MADEIPPAPSENPEDVTKSETIRITLPAKSDQPAVKRETVRINVPGKPLPPVGTAPKKETTKLPVGGGVGAPGEAAKPFVPPPKPPGPPMAPKPLGAAPPKPPSLGARPTVPLKPGPGAPGGASAPEPVTQKSAAPKKETARITLPPEGAKPPLPKATVKMQPTQALTPRPSAIQQAPTIATTPATMTSGVSTSATADPLSGPLSILSLIISLAGAALVYMAYAATQTQG